MPKLKDLTNQRFGKLLILKRAPNQRSGARIRAAYFCRCDCGNELVTRGCVLAMGKTSCGCDTKEKRSSSHVSHGHSKTGKRSLTYETWASMLNRCVKGQARSKYHGDRGISVCARWRKFSKFLEDMGEKTPGQSLERKDNNKGYCKSNCEWIKVGNQSWNRRCTIWIRLDGEKVPLNVAARRLQVSWDYLKGLSDGIGDLKAVEYIRSKCQKSSSNSKTSPQSRKSSTS